MNFGLAVPNRGPMATPETIKEIAQSAERLGYRYLAVPDHIVVPRKIENSTLIRCGNLNWETSSFIETLPNGVKHLVAYKKNGSLQNTKIFKVPKKKYFLMGDNRDCSRDSRYSDVSFVKNLNLVGRAELIFFSNDTIKNNLFKFWNLHKSFRFERLFKKL